MEWRSVTLASLLFLSASAYADVDSAMQASLQSFFTQGVYINGARADLVEVGRWPDTTGALHWRMPHISNHPAHLSLIAEKTEGENKYRWYVPVRLRWWSEAIVAKTDLRVRTLLTKSMLTRKRVNVADHTGTWWRDIDGLIGKRLTRPIRTGQVIYTPYVKQPRLLKRGDQVTIITHIGGLRVQASGKAMQSAGRGERIRVRNIKSLKILQAIVLDADTVRVITGGKG